MGESAATKGVIVDRAVDVAELMNFTEVTEVTDGTIVGVEDEF